MAAPEGGVALDAETVPPSDVEIASLLEVVVEGERRSEVAEVIPRSDPSTLERNDVSLSVEERGENMAIDGDESGSDIDPKRYGCSMKGLLG